LTCGLFCEENGIVVHRIIASMSSSICVNWEGEPLRIIYVHRIITSMSSSICVNWEGELLRIIYSHRDRLVGLDLI